MWKCFVRDDTFKNWFFIRLWPSGKLPFECQKNCQKLDIFFKKIDNKSFFKNFCHCFKNNVKVLSIFWHSNGNFPEGQSPTCSHSPDVHTAQHQWDFPLHTWASGLWWSTGLVHKTPPSLFDRQKSCSCPFSPTDPPQAVRSCQLFIEKCIKV